MKQLLFVIQFIAFSLVLAASDLRLPLQGLNYDLEEYNKTDNAGRKTGIWIYESQDTVVVSYYTAGVKNGIENRYIKLKDSYYLEYHKVYINGNLIMPSIAYYNNGLVKYEIIERYEIDPAQPTVIADSNHTSSQCFIKKYSPTGRLESEGWIIVPSDDTSDNYIKTGCWKYYTCDGDIEIVNHPSNFIRN